MLELATLGLLHREPMHGYRLKQQLELFMSNCISVNYGAIYPLLKRLEKQGHITAVQKSEEGVSRRLYDITPLGQRAWQKKMLEQPHESWVNSRSRFAIKFFFFSQVDAQVRVSLLENRLSICHLRLESVGVERTSSLDPYESALWERYLDLLSSEIQWLAEQLASERVGNG